MLNNFYPWILMILAIQNLTGCSTQAWYEGMQTAAKQSCQQQPSSEQERCEARLNKQDFDAYEKNRTPK
ncbi:MAG TPA: hypothetical protein VK663_03225 [Burkholderiales bacterium]|nr:hypothetical protein [Burkholderiales bacterium]